MYLIMSSAKFRPFCLGLNVYVQLYFGLSAVATEAVMKQRSIGTGIIKEEEKWIYTAVPLHIEGPSRLG